MPAGCCRWQWTELGRFSLRDPEGISACPGSEGTQSSLPVACGCLARSQEARGAGRNSREITALQLDCPLPYPTNAISALGMAQAELPVLCTEHHSRKESFGGCLDQRSELSSSVWVCLSTLLPFCSRITAVEQNPAGRGRRRISPAIFR